MSNNICSLIPHMSDVGYGLEDVVTKCRPSLSDNILKSPWDTSRIQKPDVALAKSDSIMKLDESDL